MSAPLPETWPTTLHAVTQRHTCARRQFLLAVGAALLGGRRLLASPEPRGWVEKQVYGPFCCTSAFPLGSLGEVFQEMSQLEAELHRTLAVPSARQTVDVFLLADEASHRAFLAQLYPHVPYRRALYVRRGGQGAIYAYQHPELAVDLRHESTHALLHSTLPEVPLWLDEGLAEYFEVPAADRASNHPHLAAVRWSLRLGMFRQIEDLQERRAVAQMGSIEYRFAWAWVHFMLHGPAVVHRTLVQFLTDLRRGNESGDLALRLRAAAPDLDERFQRHLQGWRRTTC